MGFETTVPASARAKTVHALDRSATVTGSVLINFPIFGPPQDAVVICVLFCVLLQLCTYVSPWSDNASKDSYRIAQNSYLNYDMSEDVICEWCNISFFY
jgi:hypothetical protein